MSRIPLDFSLIEQLSVYSHDSANERESEWTLLVQMYVSPINHYNIVQMIFHQFIHVF